jgi:hypothetical protein
MYSVTAPVGAAPSQVGKQETSFAKHCLTTQVAIDRQMGSFGQLAALSQQFAAAHETHVVGTIAFVTPKIWLAPGHTPASATAVAPAPMDGCPPSPCGALRPAETEVAQGKPFVASQAPSSDGLSVLEHPAIAHTTLSDANAVTTATRGAQTPPILFKAMTPQFASNGHAERTNEEEEENEGKRIRRPQGRAGGRDHTLL